MISYMFRNLFAGYRYMGRVPSSICCGEYDIGHKHLGSGSVA